MASKVWAFAAPADLSAEFRVVGPTVRYKSGRSVLVPRIFGS